MWSKGIITVDAQIAASAQNGSVSEIRKFAERCLFSSVTFAFYIFK